MNEESGTDPGEAMEQEADELETRNEQLGEHLDEARAEATKHAEHAGQTPNEPGESGSQAVDDVAGDWQGKDDQAGGEDPVGAHEERDEPAEDGPSGGET